jgi:hypothetical protein
LIITHRIAEITVRTESDVPVPYLLTEPFSYFRAGDGKPDVSLQISQFDPDHLTLPPLSNEERECIIHSVHFPQRWLDNPLLRSPAIRASVHACLARPELTHIGLRWNRAIVRDFLRNTLDFFYPPKEKSSFAGQMVLARFRNLLAGFLPNFTAVMIHGASVVHAGVAAVFLAPDEGGKTTISNLAADRCILNDDHIVLRQVSDSIVAHGTPFGPVTAGPHSARLGGFFLLEKGSRFDLTSVPASRILRFLWDEHMHVWTVLPKRLKLQAFDLLYNACHQAAAYRLRFPKDYVDWDAIGAAMAGQQ